MTTARKKAEQRVFVLKHDSKYEELLLEAIRHIPELNKALQLQKLSIESARELAYKAVELYLVRSLDQRIELDVSTYDDWIDKVLEGATTHGVYEQREAYRAWFKFMHESLKQRMSDADAFRTFILIAPSMVDALASQTLAFENAASLIESAIEEKEKDHGE